MRAFIFPGQGSQQVGMGKALAEASAAAREVFEEVDERGLLRRALERRLKGRPAAGLDDRGEDLHLVQASQGYCFLIETILFQI